jgi:hypothetical protein
MTTELSGTVNTIVPMLFEATREQLQLPPYTDMSHSNRCDRLSLNGYAAFTGRHLPVRRERHDIQIEGENLWHYVLAHTPEQAAPTHADIITDFNPWQFEARRAHAGILHGPRDEVQQMLADAGAPEWFVSLRGLATITTAHTTVLAQTTYR